MPSIFERTFQIGEIGKVLDVSPATLRTHLNRGLLVGHRQIEGGGGPGHHKTFTWFNLMEFAVAQELLRVTSLSPKAAFKIAAGFAHVGNGELPGAAPERIPGFPYPDPFETLLVVAGEEGDVFAYDARARASLRALVNRRFPQATGFSTLFLDSLFENVCRGLGLHPSAVLEEVYGH